MPINQLLLVILILAMVQTTCAGPLACAACITAAAAVCIAKCSVLIFPQAILICAMECEVAAAYGVCAAVCLGPTP